MGTTMNETVLAGFMDELEKIAEEKKPNWGKRIAIGAGLGAAAFGGHRAIKTIRRRVKHHGSVGNWLKDNRLYSPSTPMQKARNKAVKKAWERGGQKELKRTMRSNTSFTVDPSGTVRDVR